MASNYANGSATIKNYAGASTVGANTRFIQQTTTSPGYTKTQLLLSMTTGGSCTSTFTGGIKASAYGSFGGKVGIGGGTSTSTGTVYKLKVTGNGTFTGAIVGATYATLAKVGIGGGTGSNNQLKVTGSGTFTTNLSVSGGLYFNNAIMDLSPTSGSNNIYWRGSKKGSWSKADSTDNTNIKLSILQFVATNNAGSMTINLRGDTGKITAKSGTFTNKIGIGGGTSTSANPIYNLKVTGNGTFTGTLNTANIKISDTATFSGTVSATAFLATSDIRLKENIYDLDNLMVVDKLRPVSYNFKNNTKQQIGLIAQELQEIYPYLVSETITSDKSSNLSINYNGLIGILIKEVKCLKAEIQNLKTRMELVENK